MSDRCITVAGETDEGLIRRIDVKIKGPVVTFLRKRQEEGGLACAACRKKVEDTSFYVFAQFHIATSIFTFYVLDEGCTKPVSEGIGKALKNVP